MSKVTTLQIFKDAQQASNWSCEQRAKGCLDEGVVNLHITVEDSPDKLGGLRYQTVVVHFRPKTIRDEIFIINALERIRT